MDPQESVTVPPTDAAGPIAVDTECRHCGYNLRGLQSTGLCPECGTPITLSLQGDILRFADPDWLQRVARGLTIIAWMFLLATVIVILGAVAASLLDASLQGVFTLAAETLTFYGVWLMTARDPSSAQRDTSLTARKVVRVTLLIGLVGSLLEIGVDNPDLPPAAFLVLAALIGLASLASVVGEFAKFIFYERLARRIPDEKIAKMARFLKWAFTSAFGAMLLLAGLGVLASWGPAAGPGLAATTTGQAGGTITVAAGGPVSVRTPMGPAAGPVLAIVMCLAIPLVLCLLVFSLMYLVMIFQLRSAVARIARLAVEERELKAFAGALPPTHP